MKIWILFLFQIPSTCFHQGLVSLVHSGQAAVPAVNVSPFINRLQYLQMCGGRGEGGSENGKMKF